MSTAIQWTDETWNPMTGCTKLSAGCDNCYAFALAHQKPAIRDVYLAKKPVKDTAANRLDSFAPRFWPDRLAKPYTWRSPKRVFVNSMSDVFHAQFSIEQIQRVFAVMNDNLQHQFQVLTKRPERAARLAIELTFTPNIWIGTSIESMKVARRADALREIQADVRFISAEPLLAPLDHLNLEGIHWVIGGGESGPNFRSCELTWARSLRDACVRQHVAFFWKQWGGRTPKAGGRLLDGREWNEYPMDLPKSTEIGEFTSVAVA
ncbi:MAG: phage Gp37/Gp68 family protein [Gemmatimonadaceae bacterium]|nr:phage Gp37/Gp68 family protein [Gemmatimonadaceae bacterium]